MNIQLTCSTKFSFNLTIPSFCFSILAELVALEEQATGGCEENRGGKLGNTVR